ncbi:MAG TPA: PadR family transcriptional regulator [Solirubrobacteraceae bacterium]|nr:PadR family transcriptional regulator [Solirubrobacteraceae bacterium]
MERKPIRLTTTSYAVMSLLELCDGATPYELKQMLEQSIQNFWPVPHTTFYEEPARLAAAGYLSADQEQTGRRRKRYSLTDAGRDALRAWANAPGSPPSQYRDEAMLKVFAGADPQAAFRGRIDWHRTKLAELEGYLAGLKEGWDGLRTDQWRGPEATVHGGIAYHRAMVETFERLLPGDQPETSSPSG